MLCWVDLETTGLNSAQDKVLEIACVITDDKFVELGRFARVTSEARHCDLAKVDPYVRQMHATGGLWNESILADNSTVYAVDEKGEYCRDEAGHTIILKHPGAIARVDHDLRTWIYSTIQRHLGLMSEDNKGTHENWQAMHEHIGEKKGPQLAGSTVGFDRAFMQVHLPKAHDLLHYRSLDVSSLNEFAKRFVPGVYESRPRGNGGVPKHRAMDDILESLEVARHYSRRLGPVETQPLITEGVVL
jgi:oligoribonuclease